MKEEMGAKLVNRRTQKKAPKPWIDQSWPQIIKIFACVDFDVLHIAKHAFFERKGIYQYAWYAIIQDAHKCAQGCLKEKSRNPPQEWVINTQLSQSSSCSIEFLCCWDSLRSPCTAKSLFNHEDINLIYSRRRENKKEVRIWGMG